MEKQINAVGRRKEAVTRVFLSKGDGKITVNDKDYKVYFPLAYLQNQVELPLKTIEASDKFDVKVNATGGGIKGQAEAIKLGISRALLEVNPRFPGTMPLTIAAGVDMPKLAVQEALGQGVPEGPIPFEDVAMVRYFSEHVFDFVQIEAMVEQSEAGR